MHNSHIELWRVGNISCKWLGDWRRIRVQSGREILSDQTLSTPSEALAAARELRKFFKFISAADAADEQGHRAADAGIGR